MTNTDTPGATGRVPAKTWVALMGKRDVPTDGVEDYCTFLGRALAQRGVKLDLARVEWFDRGWMAALWKLWRQSADWRGAWVLIQYTGAELVTARISAGHSHDAVDSAAARLPVRGRVP